MGPPDRVLPRRLFLALAGLLAVGAVAAFVYAASREPSGVRPVQSRLIAAMQPSAEMGMGAVNVPRSTLTVTYHGDPKGYFREEDPRSAHWWLRTAGGNQAHLIFPRSDPDALRVEITRAANRIPFDIQPNFPRFRAVFRSRYALRFRARSDRPRRASVGFGRAHGSWEGLGLYEEISLMPAWQSFEKHFVATAEDDNARIFFDLGGDSAPVEISRVELRTSPAGETILPADPPDRYSLVYRFDALGCRGPERPIPKESGTHRVLLLGNNFTLGEGIPEEATLSSRLETLLNAGPALTRGGKKFEVINCGAAGYGTREERLFYESDAHRYQPGTVVAVMTWSDDLPFVPPLQTSAPTLSNLFGRYRGWLRSRDFSACVQELLALNKAVRRNGADLVVFIFRNNADLPGSTAGGKIWNRLTRRATEGLRGTGIAVIDLGRALAAQSSGEALQAHAPLGFPPNEAAHELAAEELLGFFQQKFAGSE